MVDFLGMVRMLAEHNPRIGVFFEAECIYSLNERSQMALSFQATMAEEESRNKSRSINLADPGWCRTDLGGQQAPNAPESAIPGIVAGVFVNDGKSGRCFGAQAFAGMSLEDAVRKAEQDFPSPY